MAEKRVDKKYLAAVLAFAGLGAIISRWHGGGFFKAKKFIKNLAFALPFPISNLIAYCQVMPDKWLIIFITSLIAFAFGMLKATGHGRGFRLKEPMEDGSKPEAVEKYLIGWLMPYMPLYWYKVLIMATVGFLTVLGASLALGHLFAWSGLIAAVGGLLKGVNAVIFDKKTEYREFADGFTAYFFLAVATIIVLVQHEIITF